MNRRTRAMGVGTLAVMMGVLGLAASVHAQVAAPTLPAHIATAVLEALTGPEGEYAAYASYAAVLEEYGDVEPYATIADAELRHIDALRRLLDKYDIAYPLINPYLGAIDAPMDLETAAQAWAEGERANVALYDDLLLKVADYADITRVFLNLQSASRDAHLPAFERAAESGGTVTPEQMTDRLATCQHRSGVERLASGGKGGIRSRGEI